MQRNASDIDLAQNHAKARAQSGAVFVREAVVRLTGKKGKQPFRLLGWRQGERAAVAAHGCGCVMP